MEEFKVSVRRRLAQGGIIFDNLPIIFAMGVAIGLAGGDGVAAIAAFVGYIIMNKRMVYFEMSSTSIM